MEIKIQSVKFKLDEKLEQLIEKKVEKFAVLMPKAHKVEVILRLSAEQKAGNKITEIRLHIPGYDLFAEKEYDSFEEGIDDCVDAIKRQIEKAKESL